MIRELRMAPTLLRVGLVATVAYRAEFLVWVLTTNLPLINLALWAAVARDAPVGRWGQADFAAYFLCTLIVRQLTGAWVAWELTMAIRNGSLALRLLRPVHPIFSFAAENVAGMPMRLLFVAPIAAVIAFVVGPGYLSHDAVVWAAVPITIFNAWLMTFLVMAIIGSFTFFVDSALSFFEVWLGLYQIFSGYLVPLELFPGWLQSIAAVLPFRLMLGFSVEAMLGLVSRRELAEGLALQAVWIAVLALAFRAVWRAGLRRNEAFGG